MSAERRQSHAPLSVFSQYAIISPRFFGLYLTSGSMKTMRPNVAWVLREVEALGTLELVRPVPRQGPQQTLDRMW